ncbi:hypothetical protein HPB49_006130 [Dermacentor silvarum]|uniref:Uncharacterized protein n=1 Tax=Dermacentor silvarum TaxID=543639 RepID=A0ACB8CDG7_DERSI|nr:hypothetical protein HPB49_006130 [Dermacentor silvarum]
MAKLKLKQAFKMDASAFYGSARLEDHSRSRRKVGTSSAEQFLLKIANGNVSDGDFSDDELDETVEITSSRFLVTEGAEPLEYFLKYFPADMLSELAKFTNIYALQQEGVELQTTADEMKVFFGIMMRMAVLKHPRIRMYWQEDTKVPTIADTMSCKRFFKLRAMLHVTDVNSPRDPTPDKFWKVRPIISAIQTQCLKLVPLPDQSIDEQIIPFTGRVVAKQFVKGKPNPEGIKVFVRCSADGLAHDLEIYQGKGTGVSENHFHLGLGGSVVMRLVEHAPHGHNIRVYMDNYFSSVPLLRELKELGILASGTIRSNRLLGCPLKSDKELKQTGRGSYDRKVSEEGDIVIVRWHDNGLVNMVSTITGIGELSKVKRWNVQEAYLTKIAGKHENSGFFVLYSGPLVFEDLRDLEIPAMYEMLPADCHSAQHSYVLGPRAQVAGSKRADGVPSTHEPVPVLAQLGVETPLFTPVDGKSTAEGLRVTLKSVRELSIYLLKDCDFKYVLTVKMNQGLLERFFGIIRQAGGQTRDNPSHMGCNNSQASRVPSRVPPGQSYSNAVGDRPARPPVAGNTSTPASPSPSASPD